MTHRARKLLFAMFLILTLMVSVGALYAQETNPVGPILVPVGTATATGTPAPKPQAGNPYPNLQKIELFQGDASATPRQIDIVGGQPADPGEWPWQSMLRVFVDAQRYSLCGGSLIHAQWVLTAAHCVYDANDQVTPTDNFEVILGEHNRTVNEGTEQVMSVVQVIPHPGYDSGQSFENDIALLKLSTPAQLNNRVKLVSLLTSPAFDAFVEPGDMATVTGWGTTSEGGQTASVLMEVAVPIVSNAACNSVYGDISNNMLCAGYVQGGKDSCQGDSGGPFVVFNGDGWLQAGVVSFGNGCARPNVPGVYTRVSQYIDWINGHVENNTTPTVTPTATTPTVTPTVTTTPGPNALKNGDFEQGADGTWTESSSQFGGQGSLILHSSEVESVTPRSGEYLAWLGGADDEVSELSQQVKIPNNAKLTFYVQSYSGDVCGYDFLKLLIDDIAVASADLCESTNTSTWKKTEVDLSDLAGQTVTLTLYVSTDDAIPSNLFIDDVALTGTGGGSTPTPVTPTPVTPTATPTPPIKNGDFEQGANDEWLEQSLKLGGLGMLIVDKSKLPQGKTPFSGSYAVKMGGIAEEESTLSQSQIELDTGVEGLVYQYWIDSSGSCNTDKATVEINGVVVATHQLCQQTNTKGWKQAHVDLKPYAGETINLTFHLITDAEDDSLFLLDDVAVAYPKPDSSSLYLPMLKR